MMNLGIMNWIYFLKMKSEDISNVETWSHPAVSVIYLLCLLQHDKPNRDINSLCSRESSDFPETITKLYECAPLPVAQCY